jgi:predicted HTH domain antitoxin
MATGGTECSMSLTIPDQLLRSARITADELRVEIAVVLYQQEKLTLAQAARFARMGRFEFQNLLASREIPLNYDVADFEQDLKNLRELGRL